jgi:hypothetical protein
LKKRRWIAIGRTKDIFNRLYTSGSGLIEYTWAFAEDPYNSTKTTIDKLQPINNYFRRGYGWTTIWYHVDRPGDVSLKLYSINGELIKTLYSGYKTQGEYSALWTGKDEDGEVVGSGIYLIHYTAPGINTIKKICVVR